MTEGTPEQSSVDVTVGSDADARTTVVAHDEVFIYAPAADPEDPRIRRVMERAAAQIAMFAADRGGPKPRVMRDALVTIPSEPA